MAKPITAGPPILKPLKNPPKSTTRGKALAVVVSVDNPQSPQFATVAINDHFPFESGFAVPMGDGPFAEGAGVQGNVAVSATASNAITQVNYPVSVTVANSGTGMQGIVSGNVNTAFNVNIAPGSRTITPTTGTAMAGIRPLTHLIVGTGTAAEEIVVQSVTGTTFKANFTQSHTAGDPITDTGTVLVFDTAGDHPESINVLNCTYNGGSDVGGTFQATFAYTHNAGALISNLGSQNHGFFYFYNNSDGVGGSICWVDLDTKQILSFTGYTSTVAPTPYYQNILTHRHNGNYDPSNFQNPGPVNISYPETIGNLPYWQNTIVLQGVVDSDGNVIAVDFNAGMLKRISPSYAHNVLGNDGLAGLYEPLQNPIEDNVAFLLAPKQWLWVEWQLTFNSSPTFYLGPTFIDDVPPASGGPNVIQVRFEPPADSGYPINTNFPANVASGVHSVTPVSGTGIANMHTNDKISVGTGATLEIVQVTVSGSSFTPQGTGFKYAHNKSEPIVAYAYGHVYCGSGINPAGLTQVTTSKFTYPHDMYSTYGSLHWANVGIQYVGGTQYRVIVQYNPNNCGSNNLLDFSFDSSIYTTSSVLMVPPLLPGFAADVLADASDMFFKKFEYRTTKPGSNGNPNPGLAPSIIGTTGFTTYQATGPGATFDVLILFDVDPLGHVPQMSDWGGQIVLLASQAGQNKYGQYGVLQPCAVGIQYNSAAYATAGFTPAWITNLGVGSQWDLAIAYLDPLGVQSPIQYVGTVVPPGGVGNLGLIINTNLNTPNISSSSATPLAGPIDIASDVQATITLDGSTTIPFTADYTKLVFYYRVNGSSHPFTTAGEIDLAMNGGHTAWLTGGTNPYNFIYVQLHNGVTYDFDVGFSGNSGYSPLAHPSGIQNIVNTPILVHGKYLDNGNPVPLPAFSSTSISTIISDTNIFAAADLQFTTNNQPSDGTLGRVAIWSYTYGTNKAGTAAFKKLVVQGEQMANTAGHGRSSSSTGTYDFAIDDLNNGQWYVFYATYISNSGKETPLQNIFTQGYHNAGFTTGIQAGDTSFYYNGNSGPYGTNGVTANVVAGSVLIVDPLGLDGSGNSIAEVITVKNTYAGGGANPIPLTGSTSFAHNHTAGCPVISAGGYIGTQQASVIIVPPGNLAVMPSTITLTADHVTTNPPYDYIYTGGGEGSYHVTFHVIPTLSNLGGNPYSSWGAGFAVFTMINDDASGTIIYNANLNQYSLSTIIYPGSGWTNGTEITGTCSGLSVNHNYQIAICAVDQYGNYSGNIDPPTPQTPPPAGWPNHTKDNSQSSGMGIGVFTVVTKSQYNPQDNPNMVPDSDMAYAWYSTSAQTHGPPNPGWHKGYAASGIANFQTYWCTWRMKNSINDATLHAKWIQQDGDNGANDWGVEANSDDQINYQAMGEPMVLKSGVTYCLSVQANSVGCTAGAHGASPPAAGLVGHTIGSQLQGGISAGGTTLVVSNQPSGGGITGTWQAGDFITIYDPGPPNKSEAQRISGTPSGSGPVTIHTFKPFIYNHANNTPVYLSWNPSGPNNSQIIAEVPAAFGTKGEISLLYTPPNDVVASIIFQSHKCNVQSGAGNTLKFSKPMVQQGNYPGAYKSGPPLKG